MLEKVVCKVYDVLFLSSKYKVGVCVFFVLVFMDVDNFGVFYMFKVCEVLG